MITIITLGKVKEKHLAIMIEEYIKRLSKWTKIHLVELKDEKIDKQTVPEQLKNIEAERVKSVLLKKDRSKNYIIALDETGKQFTSHQFADFIKEKTIEHDIVFIIGGTIGLHSSLLKEADLSMGFAKMTFTRDMARLFLTEQLFRAHKINSGEGYQK